MMTFYKNSPVAHASQNIKVRFCIWYWSMLDKVFETLIDHSPKKEF